MKSLRTGLIAAALLGGLIVHPAWADKPRHEKIGERSEAKRAQALLDKAVAYYKEKGDKALPGFTAGGDFVDGEYYIFVVSTAGKMLASGGSSALLIGQDVNRLRDASGKMFMRELLDTAKTQGAGVIEYQWLNQKTAKVEAKTTLYRKVGDAIIAAGYYLPRSSPQEAKGMLEEAVDTLKKKGPDAFAAFNDPKGEFVHDDLYVFAVGIDDAMFHAHGAAPSLVGKPAAELRDAQGKEIIKEMLAVVKVKGSGEVGYVWRNPVTNRVETKHSMVQKVDKYMLGVGYYTK